MDTFSYLYMQDKGDAGICAIMPLLYTSAIVSGIIDTGYEGRWCYKSNVQAKIALDAWDGTGEPEGWHRHPSSGRRRDDNGIETICR